MPEWRREIRKRLAPLNLVPAREAEIAEELAQHLEDRYEELLSGGATPEEAYRAAFAEVRESEWLRRELRRVERSAPSEAVLLGSNRRNSMLGDIWQDLRYAVRTLGKNSGFALIAVLTLGLGLGANTAIFSLINTALLRPLPVERPDRLVTLNNGTEHRMFPAFSYPNYRDFRDRNDVFSSLIGYRFAQLSLSHDGINERLWGFLVTGNYFETLGVKAALGRMISADDDRSPGAHPVAVVSYNCWRQRFGGDPGVIGKNVIVNGLGYTIIGVAQPGFSGTEVIVAPEMWFPMMMQSQIEVGSRWLDDREWKTVSVMGRLAHGVRVREAEAALNSIAQQLDSEFPNINEGMRVTLLSPGLVGSSMRGAIMGFAGLLMVVVGMALLLACANLANLLLARATERRREIAVRLALGASRFRLLRQLLTESLLLAAGGGVLGFLLAVWLARLTAAIKLPIDVPLATELHVDVRVFIFACLVSLATGLLFGLLPAWQATRTDLASALKNDGSFGSPQRSLLKSGLIVVQVALSLALLVGSGLMVRALLQAQTINLGYDPQGAIEISFDLRLQGYDSARGREFQKRLLERVRALPGVESAGIANIIPVDLHISSGPVSTEGQPPVRRASAPRALTSNITPGYFRAMKTRLLRGRDFTEYDDDKAARVAIINETFARIFWPGEDPLGKQFALGGPESPKMQVVGVAQDGKYTGLNENQWPFVYRPQWQYRVGATTMVVRAETDPQKMIALVRRELQQLDPNMPLSSARTLVERLSLPLLPARIVASALGGFGLVALLLAAIGIYGVMSYAVSRRTHEIGVRMALGANRRDVLKLIMRQGTALALIGVAFGLLAALGLTRLMKSVLFGVSATDPLTYAGVAALLTFVAMLACYIPARRAAKVDPMIALRCE
jgi:macrolide transport system ATP-binding/permease protein